MGNKQEASSECAQTVGCKVGPNPKCGASEYPNDLEILLEGLLVVLFTPMNCHEAHRCLTRT